MKRVILFLVILGNCSMIYCQQQNTITSEEKSQIEQSVDSLLDRFYSQKDSSIDLNNADDLRQLEEAENKHMDKFLDFTIDKKKVQLHKRVLQGSILLLMLVVLVIGLRSGRSRRNQLR